MTSSTKADTKAKCTAKDDPRQSERFLEAAREAEADETTEGADKAFRAAVGNPKAKTRKPGA
jgi:hypothetical protein